MTWQDILKTDNLEKKWMDRFKKITEDGITFADKAALDLYNNTKLSLPSLKQVLLGVGNRKITQDFIQAQITKASNRNKAKASQNVTQPQAQQQTNRDNYQQATRTQRQRTTSNPHPSVWREATY